MHRACSRRLLPYESRALRLNESREVRWQTCWLTLPVNRSCPVWSKCTMNQQCCWGNRVKSLLFSVVSLMNWFEVHAQCRALHLQLEPLVKHSDNNVEKNLYFLVVLNSTACNSLRTCFVHFPITTGYCSLKTQWRKLLLLKQMKALCLPFRSWQPLQQFCPSTVWL